MRRPSPGHRLLRGAVAAVTAFAVLVLGPAALASDVEKAREEVAELGRQVEAASEEYAEVEARLTAQQSRVAAAEARAKGQAELVDTMETQLTSIAVETFKLGGVDPHLSLLATGDLDLADSASTLTLIAERRSLTLDDLREAQVELDRLRDDAKAELVEVEALEADLAERRADIETKLAGAKDVLAIAEEEERARVAAEEARRAAEASRAARADTSGSSAAAAPAAPNVPAPAGNGQLATPTTGRQSAFGWRIHPVYGVRKFHSGMDIITPCGTPVVATADGTVTSASWNGSYGNIIVVEHGGGLSSAYAHLSEFVVTGGAVSRGQVIGYVGTTGLSTGCHLHFEVRVNGEAVDPARYI